MLRAAEAELQAEASRALIGAYMGPGVNSATSPVHGARNRKGCAKVAKQEAPDLLSQVRGLKSPNIGLLPFDKRKVVCFCNPALGLSVVTSCYRSYPDGSFKRKTHIKLGRFVHYRCVIF